MQEIEIQAAAAQQQIGLARSQMTAKQRERRLVRLTLDEMENLPNEAVVYEGVGKMYVRVKSGMLVGYAWKTEHFAGSPSFR